MVRACGNPLDILAVPRTALTFVISSGMTIRLQTYMPPRMVLMPGNEILVGQNDGQRMVQRFRRFNRSRIVALAWNGFSLVENWQTASQQGYLGDFSLADADNDGKAELVMVIQFMHGGLMEAARSSIVIYELE